MVPGAAVTRLHSAWCWSLHKHHVWSAGYNQFHLLAHLALQTGKAQAGQGEREEEAVWQPRQQGRGFSRRGPTTTGVRVITTCNTVVDCRLTAVSHLPGPEVPHSRQVAPVLRLAPHHLPSTTQLCPVQTDPDPPSRPGSRTCGGTSPSSGTPARSNSPSQASSAQQYWPAQTINIAKYKRQDSRLRRRCRAWRPRCGRLHNPSCCVRGAAGTGD